MKQTHCNTLKGHRLTLIFYVILLHSHILRCINAEDNQYQICTSLRPTQAAATTPWPTPSLCADFKYTDFRTVAKRKGDSLDTFRRTNTIEDFCIVTDIYGAASPTPAACNYNNIPAAGAHSAGQDPHWTILGYLAAFKAQSFQPNDDLPFVHKDLGFETFLTLKYDKKQVSPPFPASEAPNPYFVEVTGVSFKGELLHNFLHFRIFANLSVALGKDQQFERGKVLHHDKEKPNHAVGKISALLIMVKDQDGWPVGDFSQPIPCMRTCTKHSHDVYYGDESNAVPCSYTPPLASMHPGMFVFDADPGRYCPYDATTKTPPTGDPYTARSEGVREVHATWSFGHNTCNFVQRLYIQTLVIEDVEKVYKAKFADYGADQYTLFGWTAQYNILQTTRSTLGAPDYVDLKYLKDREMRGDEIDCHVPLFDAEHTVKSNFRKFHVPKWELMLDPSLEKIQDEIKVPSRSGYMSALWAIFRGDKNRRYFGQNAPKYGGTSPGCRELPKSFLVSDEVKKVFGEDKPKNLASFFEDRGSAGIRCPCPALASTLAPENRTADPARLHGRLIHASHMAIAYMFLTPIGCFVARYYKETFVTIFCFQEYWWFMWHVVTLIAACLFNIGAITSIARKKTGDLKYNDNLIIHILFGAASIFVFYMEIVTGFFRVANPKKRMRQIFTHWLIGVTNNACAVFSMFAMAWVDQSGFSCRVAYTLVFWLLFVILCYVIMEVDMRKTDKKLRLVPRRSYLPPPVKRLFTKEPPGRRFRLTMLVIFILGLVVIQGMVSYYLWNADGGASCQEEFRESARQRNRKFQSSQAEVAAIPGADGGAGYNY